MTPANLSRRLFLSPILVASGGAAAAPVLTMPKALPPGGPPRGQSVEGVMERLRESLPSKSTGKPDVDFALIAAPLLDLLAELADDRAAATTDPVLRKACAKLAGDGGEVLQTLIDWLAKKGHAAQ